jgi:ribosome-associated protein
MEEKSDPRDQPPSKTRLKQDAHELQQLGTDLLEIPESDWLSLQLPDDLISALRETKRIRSRGARKRQLQYVGKLMRGIDPEPIQRYFEQLRLKSRQQAQTHHQLETWRDRLIAEGDPAIEAFLQQHSQADRQHLRQLVRQVRKEREQNKPPKSSRALFRYIREL